MAIDLVVCNYRTPGDLREFLNSYEFFSPAKPHSLRIMNVDPLDDDLAIAEEYRRRNGNIRVTNLDTNVGYGRAVNLGVTTGTDDTIGIFNADTVLAPGVIDACASFLWRHNEIGIVGPRQYDENGRITHAGIFGTNQAPEHRGWLAHDNGRFNDSREAVTVSGSAYFVKRHVWEYLTDCPIYREFDPEAAGAFLETRHYYDETWCSYHAREHGFKVMYYGGVGMTHKWHRASQVGGSTERTLLPESRETFRDACNHHGIEHD